MPGDAKADDFCEADEFRDILWPKIFKGGATVKKCPNGTVGWFKFVHLLSFE